MWIHDFKDDKSYEVDMTDEMSSARFNHNYGFTKDFTIEDVPTNEYGIRFFVPANSPGVVTAPDVYVLAMGIVGAREALEDAKVL